jgi:hypothetical protein
MSGRQERRREGLRKQYRALFHLSQEREQREKSEWQSSSGLFWECRQSGVNS